VHPLTGEPLALDLLNTRARTPEGWIDALDRVADFRHWLALQADRITPPRSLTAGDLDAVRELRAQVREAVEATRRGSPVPAAALNAINEAVRAAPPYTVLEPDLRRTVRRNGDDRACLLAQLAEAAVALLSDPAAARIRACEGPQCVMLFLPAHPRRRWCSPTLCGNRVRVARYYQRRRDT